MDISLFSQISLSRHGGLLAILHKQILSQIRDNLIILNHNLVKMGEVPFPFKNSHVHYSYINSNQKSVILNVEYHDCLIYFDVAIYKMIVIKDQRLKSVYLSTDYIWNGELCVIIAQYIKTREKILLLIDTQKFTIQFFPISECKEVSPFLFNFLQKRNIHQKVVESSSTQKFFVLADYYGLRTITVINTQTEKSCKISLDKELPRVISDFEELPHRIYYQGDWVLLIWELKVVVISPSNQRKIINTSDTFLLANGGIIKTTLNTIKFIIKWVDMNGEKPTVLKLYEAHE